MPPHVRAHRGTTSSTTARIQITRVHGGTAKLAGRESPVVTDHLLENTDGVLRPHQCSLGTAACYRLIMLTRAILMTSLF